MPLRRVGLLVLCSVLLAGWGASVRGQGDDERREARAVWLKGFEFFEQAEESVRREHHAQGLAQFRQALTLFEQVKGRYPRWNSALIEYRISLCRKRIGDTEAILAQLGKPAPPEPAAALAAARHRVGELEKALGESRRDLDRTRTSLEQARREAARGTMITDDLKTLLAEKADLEKRAASLDAENRRLQQAVAATPAAEQLRTELTHHLTENEALRQRLAEAVGELTTLRQTAQETAQVKTQLQYDLDQLRESETAKQRERDKLAIDLQSLAKIAGERSAAIATKDEELSSLRQGVAREKEATEALRRDLRDLRARAGNDDLAARQLEVENERLLQDVETLHLNLAKLEGEKGQSTRLLEERARRMTDVERLLAASEADRKAARQDLETATQRLLAAQQEQSRHQARIADLERKEAAAKTELQTVSLDLGRLQEKNKAFTELALQSTKLEQVNRELQGRVAAAVTRLEQAEAERTAALTSRDAAAKALAELEGKRADLEKRNLELVASVGQIPALREQSAQAQELARKVDELASTLKQQEAEKASLLAQAEVQQAQAEKAKRNLEETIRASQVRFEAELTTARQVAANHERELAALREKASLPAPTAPPLPAADAEAKLAERDAEIASLKQGLTEATTQRASLEAAVQERDLRLAKLVTPPPAAAPSEPPRNVADPAAADPAEIVALLKGAVEAEKANKPESAIWQYQQVLQRAPDHLDALSRIGILASENGLDDLATASLESALRQDPDDIEKLLALAFTHLRQGQHYLALGVLGRATAQDPRNPDLQRYLGIACSNLGWTAAAEHQFQTSFELDGSNAETAFNLAVLLATSAPERRDEARTWYRKAIALGAETDPGMDELFK